MRLALQKFLIAVSTLLLINSGAAIAQHETTETQVETTTTEATHEDAHHAEAPEKFNAGQMIVEHITDAHDWHICDYAGKPVGFPLPIIIYSTTKGLVQFSSSRFEHGHASYEGYSLVKQKIVSADANETFYDVSITKNVMAIFISIAVLLVVFLSTARAYTRRKGQAPKGIQSVVEPFIIFVRDEIAKPNIGPKYERYLPILLTIFFFIWVNNLLGIIPIFPGGANVTGNIAVTLVLALIVFFITTFSANKDYWMHIFNTPGVPWWLKFPVPLMPVVELMGALTKPVVLTLRLFANITAGHIIVLAFIGLIFIFGESSTGVGLGVSIASVAFAVFMDVMELLVAFLQAYVFTLLSAIYFGSAVEEHHHAEEHAH
jgi:F-type H+-transporting ATPase subunit a